MITVRKSDDRGHADHGWLKTYHSFSFASYFDPQHMGYRALRVINEDWIQAGEGFGTHPHDNMEIITYIVSGALEHKDSMGNGSVIRPGELQRMTAGTGLTHSEFNPTQEETHLLQIWIKPERNGLEPGYEQRDFSGLEQDNTLVLLASQTGEDDSLLVHQDVRLYRGLLKKGHVLNHPLDSGRHGWIQVVEGSLSINGVILQAGDGASIDDEELLAISTEESGEFLLFDLA